jgi:hypothetical protein
VTIVPTGYLAAAISWNVLSATSDLAIFSGVLAAFVFLALADYAKPDGLRTQQRGNVHSKQQLPPTKRQLPLMVGAFFSFVVAAFLFAILHGDNSDDASVNPFAQAVCPCVVLAIGVVQLAVSLAIGLGRESDAFRPAKWVAFATITISIVFLTGIEVSPFFELPDKPYPSSKVDPQLLWAASIFLTAVPYAAVQLDRLNSGLASGRLRRAADDLLSALPVPGRVRQAVRRIRTRDVRYFMQVEIPITIGLAAAVIQNVLTSHDVGSSYRTWTAIVMLASLQVIVGMPLAALAIEVGEI